MGVTLREWSQQWLEVYVKPVAKPSGYEHYYDNLHKHILPKLGDMPLKSLTTAWYSTFSTRNPCMAICGPAAR